MKKRKVGIIASSMAAIAVCSSMVVGSTFALFTSEDTVNIAVTSGKVSVTAEVGKLTATTSLDDTYVKENETQVEFQNGGFASVAGNSIVLQNITPGDIVSFPVTIKNESTVSAMSRVSYKVESGLLLASGLEVTVNEEAFTGMQEVTSAWENLEETTYNFTITLPNHEDSKLDNLYMDLSTEISFAVEAVQANAIKEVGGKVEKELPDYSQFIEVVENGGKVAKVSTNEDLNKVIAASSAENPAYIVLNEDLEVSKNSKIVFGSGTNAVLDLNGKEIKSVHPNAGSFSVITVQTGSQVILQNGIITNENNGEPKSLGYTIENKGDLTLRGMTVKNTNILSALITSIGTASNTAKLKVESGYYESGCQIALKLEEYSNSEILGGTFVNTGTFATAHIFGDTNIRGGEFIHYGTSTVSGVSTGVPVEVQAMSWTEKGALVDVSPTVNIYGGLFKWIGLDGEAHSSFAIANGMAGYGKGVVTVNIYDGDFVNGGFGFSKEAGRELVEEDTIHIYGGNFEDGALENSSVKDHIVDHR